MRFRKITKEKSKTGIEYWLWEDKTRNAYAFIREIEDNKHYIECRKGEKGVAMKLSTKSLRRAKQGVKALYEADLELSKLEG